MGVGLGRLSGRTVLRPETQFVGDGVTDWDDGVVGGGRGVDEERSEQMRRDLSFF